MKKPELAPEIKSAAIWLERQPGVTSVIKGRKVASKHHNPIGAAKVVHADLKSVTVRVFDKTGSRELYVHAPQSPHRDKWVSTILTGQTIEAAQTQPRIVVPEKPVPKLAAATSAVERPEALIENAAQLYLVTPELAQKWLERNTRNRGLRDSVVSRYATDMKAGRWMVTGDAIAFDRNGNIINGQHRLWAVFYSGVAVQMLVAFGLDPDAVSVLDDHLKRSLRDVASIRRPGTTISNVHASVANLLLQTSIVATATDRRKALGRITRQAQLDSLDRHWDAIEFAFRDCFRSQKIRSICVAPVLAPIARAYYTQDRSRLHDFGRVMTTGVNDGPGDVSAVQLRNFLLRQAAAGMRSASETIYRKTERALAAFLDREKLTTLYEAPHELFPLPEDSPVKARR